MDHCQAGIIRRRNWISSARPLPGPGLGICMSMSVLSEPVPSGAVPWEWGGQAGYRDTSASSWLPNMIFVPDNNARCTAQPPKLKSPDKSFCSYQAC
eukprot:1157802-Pelagomonas_calceolata.AAC.8